MDTKRGLFEGAGELVGVERRQEIAHLSWMARGVGSKSKKALKGHHKHSRTRTARPTRLDDPYLLYDDIAIVMAPMFCCCICCCICCYLDGQISPRYSHSPTSYPLMAASLLGSFKGLDGFARTVDEVKVKTRSGALRKYYSRSNFAGSRY